MQEASISVANTIGVNPSSVSRRRARGETDEQILATGRKPNKRDKNKALKSDESFLTAQTRKESAAASLKELELAQKRGELIPVVDALRQWGTLLVMARVRITTMATACADRLAAITDPVEARAYLAKEIEDRLGHLTDDFRTAASEALGRGDSVDDAAAPGDGDGVGGEESGTE
jgi:hypothetical protein